MPSLPLLIVWSSFELTINHECTLATFVGSAPIPSFLTYIIAVPANNDISTILGAFTLSNTACPITVSIVDSLGNPLPSYLPFHLDSPPIKIFTG